MYRSTACLSCSGSARRSGVGRRARTTRLATPASPQTRATSTAIPFSPAHHIALTAATKSKSHPNCLISGPPCRTAGQSSWTSRLMVAPHVHVQTRSSSTALSSSPQDSCSRLRGRRREPWSFAHFRKGWCVPSLGLRHPPDSIVEIADSMIRVAWTVIHKLSARSSVGNS